jgi:hypothetical protein
MTVLIFCALLLLSGSITVKQRTEYNMYLKDYSVVSVSSGSDSVNIKFNEKNYSINTEPFYTAIKQRDYAAFSPFGSSYYLFKTLNRLFG